MVKILNAGLPLFLAATLAVALSLWESAHGAPESTVAANAVTLASK